MTEEKKPMLSPILLPVDPALFFSRGDLSGDPRWGDLVKVLPAVTQAQDLEATLRESASDFPEVAHYAIAGYPDDEGIRLGGGRPGASEAPSEIRRVFYKMTPPVLAVSQSAPMLWEVGNLNVGAFELGDRHEQASFASRAALDAGFRWIGLGGGHDYGYADASAFVSWCAAHKSTGSHPVRPLVINFDAHLDVRPTNRGFGSGTPFFRLLEQSPAIDFAEIGLQSQCNSRSHLEWARARGARFLFQEEIEASGETLTTLAIARLDEWILRRRPVFISIDIDAFSSAIAPGCSQSWATGFEAREFFQLLTVLIARLDVRMLSIYEVSPPLDHDQRTAKLAAQILHRLLG